MRFERFSKPPRSRAWKVAIPVEALPSRSSGGASAHYGVSINLDVSVEPFQEASIFSILHRFGDQFLRHVDAEVDALPSLRHRLRVEADFVSAFNSLNQDLLGASCWIYPGSISLTRPLAAAIFFANSR